MADDKSTDAQRGKRALETGRHTLHMHRALYLRTRSAARRVNMKWYEWISGAAYAQLERDARNGK